MKFYKISNFCLTILWTLGITRLHTVVFQIQRVKIYLYIMHLMEFLLGHVFQYFYASLDVECTLPVSTFAKELLKLTGVDI